MRSKEVSIQLKDCPKNDSLREKADLTGSLIQERDKNESETLASSVKLPSGLDHGKYRPLTQSIASYNSGSENN